MRKQSKFYPLKMKAGFCFAAEMTVTQAVYTYIMTNDNY